MSNDPTARSHKPVMAAEVLRELITDPNGVYLDATIGGAGHAQLLMEHLGTQARMIGFDRDAEAVERARDRLAVFGERANVVHGDYRDMAGLCHDLGVQQLTGVLLDLGLSSLQLDDSARGFAYRLDGPLDLRFDPSQGEPASVWLNRAAEKEISTVLFEYGEESRARQIARAILHKRQSVPVERTGQLQAILRDDLHLHGSNLGRTAARVFQALRIQVNNELDAIPSGLNAAIDLLVAGGRLVVIAYHSLEDRLAKNTLREASRSCNCPPAYPHCVCGARQRGTIVHRHVLKPTDEEVRDNSRARAARVRVFERREFPDAEGAK